MTEARKECFGILDKVFPMGKKGLREIVPGCFECKDRKICLQTALSTKEGLEFRGKVLDRTPARGFVGKIKRWSQRKELQRLKKHEQGKKI